MKKRILIGLILLAIVVVVVISRRNSGNDDGNMVLSGNVEATESDIGFKISGRVEELLAEEGQRVRKGDKLAVLDSAELEAIVSQNKASMNEASANFEELLAGSRVQDIGQAEAVVASAEAELSKAKKDHERAEVLFTKGMVSSQDVDAARKAYDVASSQRQNAVEALSLVKEGARKEQVAAGRERVKQAAAAVDVSEERLKDALLYAPVSGVVFRKNVELGETVSAGLPVYTIGDLENVWIKVYVKEDRLGLVKLGQRAEITVDSYPGKKYEGKVTFISSEAEFTPKNVQTREERVKLVFGMKVSVKNINDELKPGMPADVRIILH